MEYGRPALSLDHHAIAGRHRHVAGRWQSQFCRREQGVSKVRRKLEQAEREGTTTPEGSFAMKQQLIETYNDRAVRCICMSEFVEAYHLLKAALELSLTGDGIGAHPDRRGNLLTALTLNNLGCYHRRRGQGRQAIKLLMRAENIEGVHDVSTSTQANLCVLASDLGARAMALEHAHKLIRRVQQQEAEGQTPPPERAAVFGVLLHNLGVELHHLDLEQQRLRARPHRSRQSFHLGTEHHPDLDFVVTHDGAGHGLHWRYPEQSSSFRADEGSSWCHAMAQMVVDKYLGPHHPVSASISASGSNGNAGLGHPLSAHRESAMLPPQHTYRNEGVSPLPAPGAPIEYGRMSIDDGRDDATPAREDGRAAASSFASTPTRSAGASRFDNRPPSAPLKLGRTILGQRVDGATVAIGWPHFTLIDI